MKPLDLVIERSSAESTLRLRIRGTCFAVGDDISDRLGFDNASLNDEMARIVVALALRRLGSQDGWMTAEELGLLALSGASGGAVAKRLGVALRKTIRADMGPRLIEFQTTSTGGTGYRGGHTRGPYRLGVAPEEISVDEEACHALLAGRSMIARTSTGDFGEQLHDAEIALFTGRFADARASTQAAVHAIFSGSADGLRRAPRRDRCFHLARSFALLANIDMEMGRSAEGLVAALRAQTFYKLVRHPEGEAQALQIEAHLRGQSDVPEQLRLSYTAAMRARRRLDDACREARKGVARAVYIGVLGQRLSKLGQTRAAARHLETAFRLCEAGGSPRWMAIWAVRQAQNAIASRQLAEAECFMTTAQEHAHTLTVAGTAALTRAHAELHLVAGRLDEAERWLGEARLIGEERNMLHQLHLVDRLLADLERRRLRRPSRHP